MSPRALTDHTRAFAAALAALVAAVLAALFLFSAPSSRAADGDPCAPPVTNAVACENSKPGTPFNQWDVTGIGDPSIQGFATSMSVNHGQTVSFKIKTDASSYHIDILRLGYYQGNGARRVATIQPSASLPQSQPSCLTDSSTGLIDCGNWGVSASWNVPSDAVSGMYIALLVRDDTGGDSQIPFVVRDDSSHSDVLLTSSDATWEAYNNYGGNSLYTCTVACPPGNPKGYKAAFAVSYNRPFDGSLSTDGGLSYLWYAEYQMVRWLEQNGYDVSYTSENNIDSNGSLLTNHKLFISSGHDEYWSGNMRSAAESARDAGVNLAFFSGNEVFWKTRFGPSIDGSNAAGRTVTSYKETHFDSPVDPQDPPTWTGSWRDTRFSPPADARPENSLTGQYFMVNRGTSDITVPSTYSNLRFWRNTQVSQLSPGQSLTLSPGGGTLGYEWDIDNDNGSRPAGLFDMSSTTVNGVQTFTDYGSTLNNNGSATHHLTLYRAPSGALVFGAGTVQWAWGLDNTNAWHMPSTDPSHNPPDPNIEQATVNLFADMGVQPTNLIPGLVQATKSTDTAAPSSTITSPAPGSNAADGSSMTVTGTAADAGGGVVAGVEVSIDGGNTWHPAQGTNSWSYTWTVHGSPSVRIKSRAVDDSGNVETPSAGVTVNVPCPCSLFGSSTAPGTADSGDAHAVEVGVKFRTDTFGTINGIRFYKASANTGTHTGSLWDASGQRLAQATFTSESATGWQEVTFANPVTVLPNTTYVASYYSPNGHYSITPQAFYTPPPIGSSIVDSPPLHALASKGSVGNGVYAYGASSTFPTNSYNASNYWVDVSFSPASAPGRVTNVSATAGAGSATLTWSAPADGGPVTRYTITPYIGSAAQATTTITGTPPATGTTISGLTAGSNYTFTVTASNPNGDGPASAASNQVTPSPVTAPPAPTGVTARSATSSAAVSWQPPATDGGSAISGYTITPYVGTSARTPTTVGGSATSATISGLTNGTAYTFTVAATNSIGTGPESAASNAVTPQSTIFDFATPGTIDSADARSVELGVKFTSDTFGWITGLRFYKAAANTGTHIGSLWTSSGSQLASATFTNESASGWQQVDFSSPVLVSPNTTYVAAYLAPKGHYSTTSPGLTAGVDNPPLHALANSVSPDGVYLYTSATAFPTNTFNASNYWVDVSFTPAPAPGQVTGVSATTSAGAANVSWSAPSGGGPVTKYTITPYVGSTAMPSTTVTGSPPSTSATVRGLDGGTTYTFTVTASNPNGDGPASAQSNPVTPSAATVPGAPTGVTARSATSSAQVSWQPPNADGGRAISGYTVTPYVGSSAQTPVNVDGSTTSTVVSGLTNGTSYTFTVAATNSIGTGSASTPSNAVTPQRTIFDFGTPATVDAGDKTSAVLGVKFTSDVAGTVTGIRFYKAAGNIGTHVGSLWSSSGTLLGSATFTNESASGWQQVSFSNPITITAGTTYIASYLAPKGHYSVNAPGFTSAVDNPPLHALANSVSADGVYIYSATNAFPTNTFNASNYWVDVLFTPSP